MDEPSTVAPSAVSTGLENYSTYDVLQLPTITPNPAVSPFSKGFDLIAGTPVSSLYIS